MDIITPHQTLAIAALVGLLLNGFRGGGIVDLPGETPTNARTQVRRLTYAIGFGLAAYLAGGQVLDGIGVALVAFAVHLPGFGRPIGAAAGWEDKALEEWGPLDRLMTAIMTCAGIMPKATPAPGGKLVYSPTWALQVWGVAWLTMWGLMGGVAIAAWRGVLVPAGMLVWEWYMTGVWGDLHLSTGGLWPMLVWGIAGVVYWMAFEVAGLYGNRNKGWPAAEQVLGAFQIVAVVQACV